MKFIFLIFLCFLTVGCQDNNSTNPNLDDSVDNNRLFIDYYVSPSILNRSISDLIYGINYYDNEDVAFCTSPTLIRFGGNNTTPYNWEINCSNAGKDWYHNSFVYDLQLGKETAAIWKKVINGSLNSNKTPLITIPIIYNVAADDLGYVDDSNETERWKLVVPKKNEIYPNYSLDIEPDIDDDYVFIDESINYLVRMFGSGKVKYSLDNEPDLWTSTHPYAMGAYGYKKGEQVSCRDFVNRTIACAKAIKDVDVNAELFGFVSYGFAGYLSFQGAPDWNDLQKDYRWFIDYFLERNREESITYGKRLIDVLDIHMYPSEKGDNPILIYDNKSTRKDMQVRLQAPRRLWDIEYGLRYDPETNNWDQWIIDYYDEFLPLIPRIQQSIAEYDSEMKLAITEFQFGGYNDISGTLALCDVLGIFGKFGVYAANHWGKLGSNILLAYDLFRNYDGKNSSFGNISIKADLLNQSTDKFDSSIYASIHNNDDNKVNIIVINKNLDKTLEANIKIDDAKKYTRGDVYIIEGLEDSEKAQGKNEQIIYKGNINIDNNIINYELPKLSVAHIIIE